jgi:hypothetical protein
LHRLRGYRFPRLLIVGTLADIEAGAYRSEIVPSAVVNSLLSWQAVYDVPVVFRWPPTAAAEQVEDWAYWYARKRIEGVRGVARAQDGETGENKTPK